MIRLSHKWLIAGLPLLVIGVGGGMWWALGPESDPCNDGRMAAYFGARGYPSSQRIKPGVWVCRDALGFGIRVKVMADGTVHYRQESYHQQEP
jgi:hypothetical protein